MARVRDDTVAHCSFCNKSQYEVVKLVAGAGVFICDECVALCDEIIAEELAQMGVTGGEVDAGATDSPRPDEPPAIRTWDGLSDDELLGEMVRAHAAHRNVDRAVARHVAALRERGISWARIGAALGMTRQSAWERFSGEE